MDKIFEEEYKKFHLEGADTEETDIYTFPICLSDFKEFARHFYELGKNSKNMA